MNNLLRGNASLTAVISVAVAMLFVALLYIQYGRAKQSIKIGVLHSLSGTMAVSEAPLVDAMRLAVEEANQSGGVNGQQIEMIVADCRSDAEYCAQQAEKLITQQGVQALFGCWTSACRKAVKIVVERHHHLLFYPLQYEGLEESPDIIYTGAVPNQQIIPAVIWALQNNRKRFYLLGSDYVFPHTANLITREVLRANGGQVLAERYLPLGEKNFAAVTGEITRLKPDVILNTLNGDSNNHFFSALRKAGITADNVPVISTSIAEVELAAMGASLVAGNYAAWSYFQGIDSVENKAFVAQFKNRFGRDRVLDDPMEAAYIGVCMWVNAVREAGATDLPLVKTLLRQQSIPTPEGIVSVDFTNNHLWKTVRIGKARADGQFDVVWQSGQPVRPAPFPYYRSRLAWAAMQQPGIQQNGAWGQP
ncbi:MAG: ABC transporter substrate-binding protein [Gallionella sp.]